jgi:hypothetical protein
VCRGHCKRWVKSLYCLRAVTSNSCGGKLLLMLGENMAMFTSLEPRLADVAENLEVAVTL